MVSAGPQIDTSRTSEHSEGSTTEVNPLSRNSAPTMTREEALGKGETSTSKKSNQQVEKPSRGFLGWIEDKFHDAAEFVGKELGNAIGTLGKLIEYTPIGLTMKLNDWLAHGGLEKIGEVVKTIGKVAWNVVTSKEFWIAIALTAISIAVPAVGLAMLAYTAVEAGAALARGDYVTAGILVLTMIPGLRGAKGAISGLKAGFIAGMKEAAPMIASKEFGSAAAAITKNVALSGGALSPAAREAVTAASKPLEAAAEKYLAKNLSDTEIIQAVSAAGKNSADDAVKILAENQAELAAKGINSEAGRTVLAGVKEAAAKEGDKCVYDLLNKCGFKKYLENEVLDLLKAAQKGSKNLIKALEAQGYSKEEAKLLAKELRNTLATGRYLKATDEAIKEQLTESLTNKVVSHLKARQLKLANGEVKTINEVFQSSFDEGIDAFAKANPGKYSDEVLQAVKSAGAEGFEEGLKRGVRRIVSEAIEGAFSKFRKSSHFNLAMDSETKKRKAVEMHEVMIPQLQQAQMMAAHLAADQNKTVTSSSSVIDKITIANSGSPASRESDAGKLISILVQRTSNVAATDSDYTGQMFANNAQKESSPIGKTTLGVEESSTKTVERILGSTTTKQVRNEEIGTSAPRLEVKIGGAPAAGTPTVIRKNEAA